MNKEKSIMGDWQVQSKNAAVSFSYQLRQEDSSAIIIDKCQPVFEKQRLTAYYHGLCHIQKKESNDRRIEESPDK